ncbi:L-rhamnose mutarotase [Haloprofundus halobius]|uniref:L-rhamnose mutarotase n=1 Tax=Haloprofundus halobius TaxID=2876194 RepID=UPI001CCB73BD|nr:L-rhamnose mutarotase [Haloprofundus halobius]
MTENQDLEQVAILQRIKPEMTDEYIEAHDNVPESVIDAMVEGGVYEYRLFLRDEIAVGIIEVEDMEQFQERYESDPENEEWESHVEQFKTEGIDPDNMEMPVMEEIWSLSDDL